MRGADGSGFDAEKAPLTANARICADHDDSRATNTDAKAGRHRVHFYKSRGNLL